MKLLNRIVTILLDHGVSSILGWCAGLIVIQIINSFLEEEGVGNLWGLWSDKIVVDHSAYTIISWIITALVGWGISQLCQKTSEYLLNNLKT